MNKLAFFKKEMMEIFKTYKIIVLPAIFLFFGLLSPLTAKYLPEIMKKFGNTADSAVTITFNGEPKYGDAYAQLFGNLGQMGLIVVILIFMSIVVNEKVKGSATLVLTKTVSRSQFILSKFFSSAILFTLSYLLSVGACIYYTYLLFNRFYNDNLILGLFLMWLFMIVIIAMTILASTLAKNVTISAVLGFLGFVGFSAISSLPVIKEYSPASMTVLGLSLINGKADTMDAAAPIIISFIMIIGFLISSIYIFKKQEI